jgi:hypothetical protein
MFIHIQGERPAATKLFALTLELANKLGKPVPHIYDTHKSEYRTQIRFASRFKP